MLTLHDSVTGQDRLGDTADRLLDRASTPRTSGFDPFRAPDTTIPIGEAQARSTAVVAGTVSSVVVVEWRGGRVLQATLADGTGTVELAFVGRTAVAGIEPGRNLAAAGTVADRRGRQLMMNPQIWLEAVGQPA